MGCDAVTTSAASAHRRTKNRGERVMTGDEDGRAKTRSMTRAVQRLINATTETRNGPRGFVSQCGYGEWEVKCVKHSLFARGVSATTG